MAMHKLLTKKVEVLLCRGVDKFLSGDIAWTGGDPYDTTITNLAANGCYCPMELDKAWKVEDKCLQPLVESRHLKPISTKPGQKNVPLIQWKDVQAHLVTSGMDGVFYGVDTKNNVVLNLLEIAGTIFYSSLHSKTNHFTTQHDSHLHQSGWLREEKNIFYVSFDRLTT